MSKEAMKLALEALRLCTNAGMIPMYLEANETAIKALEEALAKQEQGEPAAKYIGEGNEGSLVQLYDDVKKGTDFYTTPQQRKPLTLEQIREHWQVAKVLDMTDAEIDFADYVLITRDVEALHGIKE